MNYEKSSPLLVLMVYVFPIIHSEVQSLLDVMEIIQLPNLSFSYITNPRNTYKFGVGVLL
ncbi:MAG: hypothetical protein ACKVJR_06190 [Flavobacteriales bacterium]|jgi:hypothetical protein